MFFFFPVNDIAMAAPPTMGSPSRHSGQRSFGSVNESDADISVEIVRHALTSFMSSVTASGSRWSALFAQISAGLAMDRAVRDTASSFGTACGGLGFCELPWTFFPGVARGKGPWHSSVPPAMHAWTGNPWSLYCEGLAALSKVWFPAFPEQGLAKIPHRRGGAPFTAVFSVPGFTWGFTTASG
jgi:hypothetical protein